MAFDLGLHCLRDDRVVRWCWVNSQCLGVLVLDEYCRVIGCAMVLGKLPVPGRHTNLDNSKTRAYCACRSAAGVVWTFFPSSVIFFSFSLSVGHGPI